MLNFFKTKAFKIGSLVVALAFGVMLTASAYTFTSPTLRVGSSGAAVMELQKLVGVTADGSFGPMTKAAVATWQAANGLTADGVFGAMSMAKANGGSTVIGTGDLCPNGNTLASNCATAPSGSGNVALCPNGMTLSSNCTTSATGSTSGTLAGLSGEIADINQLATYSNEEVGAGQKEVKVMGFDVQASKDGDIKLSSIKLTFDSSGNLTGDSDRLTDYVSNVTVWMGSTKIGSASTADFTKDATGVYSKTIGLDNTIVKADVTEKFYVAVDSISNLDSGDIDSDSWTVGIVNIRYVDGAGVTTTESSALPAAIDYDNVADGLAISFVSFSAAVDTELKITVGSDTPLAGVSKVKTASGAQTSKVVLLTGKMTVDGTSNVWLDEVPFLFTTNATDVEQVAPTVYFTIDGTEYSESMTASSGTTETITFNNLDKTLTAGKSYTFTVTADVEDIETTYFDEGDYLKAELTSTTRGSIIAENAEGDQLTDGTEMTGTAMGNIQYFYSVAPKVELVSKSIVANDNGSAASTSATAKMKIAITAQGGTIYLNGDDATSNEFITLAVDGGDASSSVSSYTFTTSGTTVTNSGTGEEYYTINDGETMYVDIEAVVVEAAGSSAILVGMKGTAVLFGTATTSVATRAASSLSFTALTDVLKTGKVTLDS